MDGLHVWQFLPSETTPGGTRLVHYEDMMGLVTQYLAWPGWPLHRVMQPGFESMNEDLKKRVEGLVKEGKLQRETEKKLDAGKRGLDFVSTGRLHEVALILCHLQHTIPFDCIIKEEVAALPAVKSRFSACVYHQSNGSVASFKSFG